MRCGAVWSGDVWLGAMRYGTAVVVRYGRAGQGGRGLAGCGRAWRGAVGFGGHGLVRRGSAGFDTAWRSGRGKVRRGSARRG